MYNACWLSILIPTATKWSQIKPDERKIYHLFCRAVSSYHPVSPSSEWPRGGDVGAERRGCEVHAHAGRVARGHSFLPDHTDIMQRAKAAVWNSLHHPCPSHRHQLQQLIQCRGPAHYRLVNSMRTQYVRTKCLKVERCSSLLLTLLIGWCVIVSSSVSARPYELCCSSAVCKWFGIRQLGLEWRSNVLWTHRY